MHVMTRAHAHTHTACAYLVYRRQILNTTYVCRTQRYIRHLRVRHLHKWSCMCLITHTSNHNRNPKTTHTHTQHYTSPTILCMCNGILDIYISAWDYKHTQLHSRAHTQADDQHECTRLEQAHTLACIVICNWYRHLQLNTPLFLYLTALRGYADHDCRCSRYRSWLHQCLFL